MADLTPNNREEHWLQGMVDGQTTLTPNNRREHWYEEIINASGGGGGGTGGGATVLTTTVSGTTVTLPCTAAELYAFAETGIVVIKYSFTTEGVTTNRIGILQQADYIPNGKTFGIYEYLFTSDFFEISCNNGSDIPSFEL